MRRGYVGVEDEIWIQQFLGNVQGQTDRDHRVEIQ